MLAVCAINPGVVEAACGEPPPAPSPCQVVTPPPCQPCKQMHAAHKHPHKHLASISPHKHVHAKGPHKHISSIPPRKRSHAKTTSPCKQAASVSPCKRLHAKATPPCKRVASVSPCKRLHANATPPRKRISATPPCAQLASAPLYQYKQPVSLITKPASRYKIILQAGAFSSYQGRIQDVYVDDIYDIYNVNNHEDQNILLGVGYYITGLDKPRYSLWYGLNAFYLAPSMVKGTVVQEGLFPNLSYRYTVTQVPVYLSVKGLIKTPSPKYDITLDAGVGPSIVRTSDIQEYARNPSSIPEKIFTGTTRVLPSVNAGVGLKMNNLFSKVPVECGYRFFYTAQTKFNNGSIPVSGSVYTGKNFVNALMCSIIL